VLAVMTFYIFATIKITDWRTELRRDMVIKSREEFAIKNDSISNYETVKVTPLRVLGSRSTSMRKSMNLDAIEKQWKYTSLLKRKLWVIQFLVLFTDHSNIKFDEYYTGIYIYYGIACSMSIIRLQSLSISQHRGKFRYFTHLHGTTPSSPQLPWDVLSKYSIDTR
jgi:hypothetical protein